MRWTYSRALLRNSLGDGEGKFNSSELLSLFPSMGGEINDSWKSAYLVARNLHFSILDVRLISRKNLELIYPSPPHIYYVQWNLLSNIVISILAKRQNFPFLPLGSKPEYLRTSASLRSISLFIQTQFGIIDSKCGGGEKIPPSHFDYEAIYTKLYSSLKEAINFHDNTSRTRTSTLQQKYYCHDDHNDADFRTDWIHAHMFSSASVYLHEEIQQRHNEIKRYFEGSCQTISQ